MISKMLLPNYTSRIEDGPMDRSGAGQGQASGLQTDSPGGMGENTRSGIAVSAGLQPDFTG